MGGFGGSVNNWSGYSGPVFYIFEVIDIWLKPAPLAALDPTAIRFEANHLLSSVWKKEKNFSMGQKMRSNWLFEI